MFLLKQLLPGALAALLVSGLLALAGQLWRANDCGDALALGIGYTSGHVMAVGWPGFPPAEATQWLPYFALASMFLAICDAILRPAPWLRALVWVCYCVGMLRLFLSSKFQYTWSALEGTLWIVGFAAVMVLLAYALDTAARRDERVPLFLTIVAGGTGVALMLSGSLLLAQLAMVLAAALAAISAIVLVLPRALKARGSVSVAVALLSSLWLGGYFFAELPAAAGLLLAFALVPILMLIASSDEGTRPKGHALRITLVIVPVALAVFLAY
ncbi:MAG TPA: hypothetical protein VIS99_05595, partial [Terrimicrobiaceae bacterium]